MRAHLYKGLTNSAVIYPASAPGSSSLYSENMETLYYLIHGNLIVHPRDTYLAYISVAASVPY